MKADDKSDESVKSNRQDDLISHTSSGDSDSSDESESTNKSFHFNPKSKLRSESEENRLRDNITVKAMNFT
jgi:hypothetical protein